MRYFFDTDDGSQRRDEDGIELADDRTARLEAVKYAGMVLSGEPRLLVDGGVFQVRVRDDHGRQIVTVTVSASAGDAED